LDELPQKRRVSLKKIVGIAALVLVLASIVGCFVWVHAHTPVKDSQKEFDHILALFEEEALLGSTKKEVYGMLGYPNSWNRRELDPFPNGLDIWDERIHLWVYSSRSSEDIVLGINVFFSDRGLAEEVVLSQRPFGSNSYKDRIVVRQGVNSEYSFG